MKYVRDVKNLLAINIILLVNLYGPQAQISRPFSHQGPTLWVGDASPPSCPWDRCWGPASQYKLCTESEEFHEIFVHNFLETFGQDCFKIFWALTLKSIKSSEKVTARLNAVGRAWKARTAPLAERFFLYCFWTTVLRQVRCKFASRPSASSLYVAVDLSDDLANQALITDA